MSMKFAAESESRLPVRREFAITAAKSILLLPVSCYNSHVQDGCTQDAGLL